LWYSYEHWKTNPEISCTADFLVGLFFFSPQFFKMEEGTGTILISGFCHEVDGNCTLMGYYSASSGSDILGQPIGPISRVKNKKMGLIGFPETSVRNYHSLLHINPEEGIVGSMCMYFCHCKAHTLLQDRECSGV
jgi:hypothetical protein